MTLPPELGNCSPKITGGSGTWDYNTITWANGKTTSTSVTVTPVTGSDEREKKSCPSGEQEYILSGTVTADTTGRIPVGGPIDGEACQNMYQAESNERGNRFTFK